MSTSKQFDKFFAKDKHYRGCIYEQFLYKFVKRDPMESGDFFILNIGDQQSGGTHWVAFYCQGNQYYYFDSFGMLPSEFVHDFEQRMKLKVIYSTKQFQKIDAISCGEWCVAWVLWMKEHDYASFEETFKLGDL